MFCLFVLSFLFLSYGSVPTKSRYKNNEQHIATKVDINGVPVDPQCKMKMVWDNVRLSGVTRVDIPNSVIKHMTVVKFHYAGAWIAWTDEKGYHEPTEDRYIPWKNFPKEIRDYYARYYLPEWDGLKVKKPFTIRTPQYDSRGREIPPKPGFFIRRRAASGVLCREVFNNVYIPYSELPLDVRTLCGFYENEAYIPETPVMVRGEMSFDDPIIYVAPNRFRIVRRFTDGYHVVIRIPSGSKLAVKSIFLKKYKGRLVPNHKSDLHIFDESQIEKKCIKCGLSDHNSRRYFNYMFDRQVRVPCPVLSQEYAIIRQGEQKVGRSMLPAYVYQADFDVKHPKDSKVLLEAAGE